MIVAAGIEREHVALAPFLLRRRAVEARAGRDQAIVEVETAVGLLPPQRFGQLALGRARAVVGDDRQHRIRSRARRRYAASSIPRGSSPRAAARARTARPRFRCRGRRCAAPCRHRPAGNRARRRSGAALLPICARSRSPSAWHRRCRTNWSATPTPRTDRFPSESPPCDARNMPPSAARPWDRRAPADSGSIPSHPWTRRKRRDARRADTAHYASRSRPGRRSRPRPSDDPGDPHRTESKVQLA